jgi:hypothetical protein
MDRSQPGRAACTCVWPIDHVLPLLANNHSSEWPLGKEELDKERQASARRSLAVRLPEKHMDCSHDRREPIRRRQKGARLFQKIDRSLHNCTSAWAKNPFPEPTMVRFSCRQQVVASLQHFRKSQVTLIIALFENLSRNYITRGPAGRHVVLH